MLIASRHPSRHAAKVTQPSPLFVRLAGFANYESTESFSNLPSRDIVLDTSEGWGGGGGSTEGQGSGHSSEPEKDIPETWKEQENNRK